MCDASSVDNYQAKLTSNTVSLLRFENICFCPPVFTTPLICTVVTFTACFITALQHRRFHSNGNDDEIVINGRPANAPQPHSVRNSVQQHPYDGYRKE